MKAHLLDRDRDFDWKWVQEAASMREAARIGRRYARDGGFDPWQALPWNAQALIADLSLNTLFDAMARGDDFILEVARRVVLEGVTGDLGTIRYRQDVLRECLEQPAALRALYAVAAEAMEKDGGYFMGVLARYPDSVLREAREMMGHFLGFLKELKVIADSHAHRFASEGWSNFFSMLTRELDDAYLARLEDHLKALRFGKGQLLSARLGKANKGSEYMLHRAPPRESRLRAWWTRLFGRNPAVFRFEVEPRDETGAQALNVLRNHGIALAATALAQAADHVRDFFGMLRAELAFYVGCVNLHEALARAGEPTCFPIALASDEQRLSFRGLYDPGIPLTAGRPAVGNDVDADRKELVMITGPNTGGKSTFLRSIGVGQLMMQSGMFVPAVSFRGSLCSGLFTHFKREEDVRMESGKLDEELGRMSSIVDHIAPNAMVLFNESFAATNEREGSEIARQVMSALLASRIRILCVTHLHELARGFYERDRQQALFLRAERLPDGTRTFRLVEGEPLPTSFGEDIYRRVFGTPSDTRDDAAGKTQAIAR